MKKDKTIYYVNAIILVIVAMFFYALEYFGWEQQCMGQFQQTGSWRAELLSITILVDNVLFLIQLPMHVGFGMHCLTAYRKQNRWWEYLFFVAVVLIACYSFYYACFATPWD
ncbi:MAG: hypothetical protein J5741_05265 [Bacteroidales bacterium]|nr:hypothetical protein [Bacteroidales bacterium]